MEQNKALVPNAGIYSQAFFFWTYTEYMLSIHYLRECALENAQKLGALDVRDLYPDVVPKTFAQLAKNYYECSATTALLG